MAASIEARQRELQALLDKAVPGALFFLALLVRLWEASLLSFPALDDPAFYLTLAQNLASGRGLAIDAVWNYQVTFASVTHPSNEHWMPLTSLALAPLFALFGSGLPLAQAIGALVGALLVPVTWHIARVGLSPLGQWRGRASFATALVAFNPLLVYQSVTVDSAAYFTLLGSLALTLVATAHRWSPGRAALVGALGGLAFMARSDGILLVGVLVLWMWLRGAGEARWRQVAGVVLGAGLVAGPWLLRNILAFGSPFPSSALVLALLPDYPTLFHYGASSYWDGLSPPDVAQLLALRLEGLGHNLFVLLVQTLFPLSPFALAGFGPLRNSGMGPALLFGSALFLMHAFLFPVPTLYGAFYHSIGAVVPFLTVLAVAGLQRFGRFVGARLFEDPDFMPVLLGIAAFVLVFLQLGSSAATAAELHRRWDQEFSTASQWLREQGAGTVMTTQPHSLHYASGLPAVMLPVSDPPEVAYQVAQRYGAQFAVGFGSFGRYPEALEAGSHPGFSLAFEREGIWIYRIQ